MEKDPLSYEWLTYVWVMIVSLWGGVSSYLKRLTSGDATSFSLAELVGEVTISGFVGLLTFFYCESLGVSPLLGAFIVGVSAHMGSRSLFMLERIVVNLIQSKRNN